MTRPFSKKTAIALFKFIEHGSFEHKSWLFDAIEAFRLGQPKPETRQ